MNAGSDTAVVSFREAYCRRYGCEAAHFETSVLRRCFPLWVRPLGALLLAVRPGMFRRELAMLGRLAGPVSESLLRVEVEGYVYENQRDKPFRVVTLGLRLSRRRFLKLYRLVVGSRPTTPRVAVAAVTGEARGEPAEKAF